MAEKTLKTRIKLRYDEYANWVRADPILEAGEVAVTAVPVGTSVKQTTPPAILFKVGNGNGENSRWSKLPWTSGLAADVYAWAKAETKPTYDYSELTGTPTIPTVGNGKITINQAGAKKGEFTVNQTGDTTIELTDNDTNTQYQLVLSDHTLKLQSRELTNGVWGKWGDVEAQSFTLPDTTYTFATGSDDAEDGTFTVTPKDGSAQSVKIKGLKSAAYTESSAYATAAQGATADKAMPKTGGTFTGDVFVKAPTADMNPATKQYVDSAIEGVSQFNYKVVTTLPTASADTMGTIYLVKHTHNTEPEVTVGTNDTYDEYLTIQNGSEYSWEKIGNTDIDLSGYYNTLSQAGSGVVTDVSEGTSGQIMVTRTDLATKAGDITVGSPATDFIATIEQAANGKITATKKSVPTMKGAAVLEAGAKGLVPAPASGDQTKFLRGDGTWADVDRLATSQAIDGVMFNGSDSVTHYGTCSTAAGTAEKTVPCNWFTLVDGARITVKFINSNSANNPTLNVNGTGAKPIYYRGQPISASYLAAERTYEFVYNGTQYELVGDLNTDTDTHYTARLFVGASNAAKSNAAATNGNVYLNLVENDIVRDYHNIKGTGATTVTSDANGVITINSSDNDTKNTAGATNTSSKIFLVGATSQGANPQTYSHDTAYVGTDGCLYSNSSKVATLGDNNSFTGLNTFKKTSTDGNTDYIIKLDNSSTTPNIVLGSAPVGTTAPAVYTKYGESAISKVSASGKLDFTFPSTSGTLALTSNIVKNTAGVTDTSSKIYLIGAKSQEGDYQQTYSHDTAYVDTDGCLYSGGEKVLTNDSNYAKLNAMNIFTGTNNHFEKALTGRAGFIATNGIAFSDNASYLNDRITRQDSTGTYTLTIPSKTGTLATTDDAFNPSVQVTSNFGIKGTAYNLSQSNITDSTSAALVLGGTADGSTTTTYKVGAIANKGVTLTLPTKAGTIATLEDITTPDLSDYVSTADVLILDGGNAAG